MTEKGEDQVVWVCRACGERDDNAGKAKEKIHSFFGVECTAQFIPYIPHSKYLTLQKNLEGAEYIIDVEHRRNNKLESDLAVAVEALEVMMKRYRYVWGECEHEPEYKQAQEALGKIGGERE